MTDAAMWSEKAASLRDLARRTSDAERERVLLVLAEDCEALAREKQEKGRRGSVPR